MAISEKRPVDEDYSVTPLELFFDLVFVFAVTQVTSLMAQNLTWLGMLQGVAVLTLVWWAWVGFAWLTNAVPIEDDDRARVVMLAAMAAMLVVAITIPQAFEQNNTLFGAAYLVVVVLFVALYAVATRGEPELNRAVRLLAPGVLAAPIIIGIAGLLGTGPVRATLWVVAIIVTLLAPLQSGTSGWRVRPAHFAERHGLVVIIALGESVVAVGLAAAEVVVDWRLVTVGGLAVLSIASMWWLYFDVVSLVAENRLQELEGEQRNALARDSYSYIHVVMVVGIVFVALGLEESVLDLGNPLEPVAAVALLGGFALYLAGHLLFRLRNIGTVNVARAVSAVALMALIPVGLQVPAFVTVLLGTLVMVTLVGFEAKHFAEGRRRIRASRAR